MRAGPGITCADVGFLGAPTSGQTRNNCNCSTRAARGLKLDLATSRALSGFCARLLLWQDCFLVLEAASILQADWLSWGLPSKFEYGAPNPGRSGKLPRLQLPPTPDRPDIYRLYKHCFCTLPLACFEVTVLCCLTLKIQEEGACYIGCRRKTQ